MLLGAIVGGIIGGCQALIALGDRLWKKPESTEQKAANRQSLECQFQHKEISSVLIQHTEALKEMVHQQTSLVAALHSTVEDAKLRHQIILGKLEMIQESVKRYKERAVT